MLVCEDNMKIIKTASDKQTIKISRKEWEELGKKAGWMSEQEEVEETGKVKIMTLY